MKNNGYTFRYSTSQARRDVILACLSQARTRSELAELCSMSVRAAQAYLVGLLAEKRIHIHAWRRNRPGSPSAVYLAGAGKDKKKPDAVTPAERSRRRRQDPEVAIDHIQSQRLARIKPRRDSLTAAFFGAAA